MIIYDNNGKLLLDIPVDDSSCRYRAIGQAKKVELHYSLPGHMELPMGSFIEYQGERYTLWSPSDIEKKGTRNLSYKVIFSGEEEVLKKYKYKQLSDKLFKLKFPLTAKPIVFIQLLVDNLNLYDSGWEVGQVIESAEKLMSFNHENCWSVLGRLAQEFDTEFEIKGKKINLQKVRYFEDSPVKLSYGKGNGFVPGVGRTNQGDNLPVEIVYVQGGEKNVNNSTYGSKTLLLPKSKELDYEGRRYKTDADGMYITRADKDLSSHNEDSYDASHIYPTRVGVISSVEMVPGKDSEGKPVTFYNIVDNKIPEALNYRDCRLDGNKATIIFQSGKLAGREFDIVQTDKVLTGYDHATKSFKLVSVQEDGETLPNETFCPLAGNEYAVFNISLPKAYVCDNDTKTGASWDMFREAARYLREHEERQFTFKGELDGIWAKKNWLAIGGKLIPGGFVDFSDTQFQPDGVLIRITGVRDYINRPHSPELELSNAPVSGFLSDSLGKLEAEEVRNDQKNKDSISFTKRSFRDAKETMGLLADALLTNFTESINPIAIATMQMLVGDESLQFRFVNSKTNPIIVPHNVTYNEKTNSLNVPAGIIQHMTLGIKEISSIHKYMFWDMGSYGSPYLEPEKKYYLYAKCSESSESGTFLVSDKAIGMGDEAGYYHFLVGALNSAYDGDRSFVTLYGFTEILPGRVTTDRVVSSDGLSYMDFVNNGFRIGDTTNYLDWNSKKDGKLRLKGTIIQNESGDESRVGCFRGIYNPGYSYYEGDQVTYAYNGGTSTYRYISKSPAQGYPPTDSTKWSLVSSQGTNGLNGTNGANGSNGSNGTDGDYYEFRYAVNGSRLAPPVLVASAITPAGWSTGMPSISSLQYLWMTVAKKSGTDGNLLINWSTPVRQTPYDGTDGKIGPTVVYCGTYKSSKVYYGTEKRVDAVVHDGHYYVARVDAGSFSTPSPTDTGSSNKWNDFGAEFESVATNLLLADGASIGNWFMTGGKIVSTLSDGNKITLDASMARLVIESNQSGGEYSQSRYQNSTIMLDALAGVIEARNKVSNRVAYMSSSGIFCNNAETQAVSAVLGVTHKAAIVGLGFGTVDKSQWDNENFIAGVYGRASNSGKAPAYGGFFQNLMAAGLFLHMRAIEEQTGSVYLSTDDSLVVGYSRNEQIVYLPNDGVIGRVIFFKQWWTGSMKVMARGGQVIYDDSTVNSYHKIYEGQMAVAIFTIGYVAGVKKEAWLINSINELIND